MVITGGGSQLKNLVQLAQYVTGMDARIGFPNEHVSSSKIKEFANPMYATGIGLIMRGFEDIEKKKARGEYVQPKQEVIHKTKEIIHRNEQLEEKKEPNKAELEDITTSKPKRSFIPDILKMQKVV